VLHSHVAGKCTDLRANVNAGHAEGWVGTLLRIERECEVRQNDVSATNFAVRFHVATEQMSDEYLADGRRLRIREQCMAFLKVISKAR
jgi:hypothetical protein